MSAPAPRFTKERLTHAAERSGSFVDMLRYLGQPLGSSPLRYLRQRVAHYAIDTRHFVDEPLPYRPPRRYTRDLLEEAATHSTSMREMVEYLGIPPYSSAYTHLTRRLRHFAVDTSHFRRQGPAGAAIPEKDLRAAVAKATSIAGVIRECGMTDTAAVRARVKRELTHFAISTAHFTGQAHYRNRESPQRKSADAILRLLDPGSRRVRREQLDRALREKGVDYLCGECGTGSLWRGKVLVLEIDHINGDRLDNRLANLRYLCPSCHSQTVTHSRRVTGQDRLHRKRPDQ